MKVFYLPLRNNAKKALIIWVEWAPLSIQNTMYDGPQQT